MTTVTTTTRDKGAGRILALIAEMRRGGAGPHVKVGVLGGTSEPDGTPTVDVAIWNEFGTDRIPERPFMRTATKDLRPVMKALVAQLAQKMTEGSLTLDGALDRMGLTAQAAIRRRLTDGPWTPNAPATVAAKGSSRPLIDSGQLRASIQYVKVPHGE